MQNSYLRLFVEVLGRGVSAIQYEEIGAENDEEAIQKVHDEELAQSGKSVSTVYNLGLKRIARGEDGLVVSVETVPFLHSSHPLGKQARRIGVEGGLQQFTRVN